MTGPTPPISVDSIARNAERIARVLNRRLSPKRLPGAAREAVTLAIFNARRTSNLGNFEADLAQAELLIQPPKERPWVFCRFLMEAAWFVPLNSPLEEWLADRVRRLFVSCKADDADHFATLREEFIALQRSSLPVVRRLVGSALIDEPVDDGEVALLNDPLQAHDTRTGIASRILSSLKQPFYDDLLDYYIQAIRLAERSRTDDPVRKAVETLTGQLDLWQNEDLMLHLLPKFTEMSNETAVAGNMMKLLRAYGTPLVNQIIELYPQPDSEGQRPAYAKLLGHMAQHGHVLRTVQAMTDLLLKMKGEDCTDLVTAFKNAASGTSAQDRHDPSGVRAGFQEALARFGESNIQFLRTLAANLRRLPWDEGISAEFVEKHLRGELSEDRAYLVRFCGAEGFEVLARAVQDPNRDVEQRHNAIKIMGLLRNSRLRRQIADTAWTVFLTETVNKIRAKALEVVIQSLSHGRRHLNELDRLRLLQEDKTATGPLRAVIDASRPILFPPSTPEPSTGTQPGGSTP